MEKLCEIGNRIKEIRTEIGLTQKEFAQNVGVSVTCVSLYETGSRIPSETVIKLLCEKWNYSEEWIKQGSGKRKRDRISLDAMAAVYETSEDEKELIVKYMALDEDVKKRIREMFT